MENNYWENLNQSTPPANEQNIYQAYTPAETIGYGYYTPQYIPPTPKETRKKKERRFTSLILVLCLLISIFGGFVGSRIAYTSLPQSNVSSAGPGVFYHPAENTSGNSTSESSGSSNSLKDVIARIADSVVEVVTNEPVNSPFFEQSVDTGAGSGVIISKDGYIVTCAHVVLDAKGIEVRLTDGSSFTARIIGQPDDLHDIALLKIDATDLTPAVIGDSDKLVVGEDAIVIGNPLGSFGGTVTNGIISALEREVVVEGTSMVLMQTNAAVNPGNSGGGIFNGKGELIGLINAKSMGNDIEGIGFAIPINLVMSVVEQLLDKGFVSTPAIGINAMYIGSTAAATEYGVERFGVYIDSLTPGKGAEAAGLLPKDFILSIDGVPIDDLNDISVILRDHAIGDSIDIEVLRQKETLVFTVVLSERNT